MPCRGLFLTDMEGPMEFLTPEFFSALLAIVLIDLVLAGDNAIVIALAARSLPPHLRKPAVLWGTFGAIAVRTLMTLAVVWLLKIPGLMAIGGVALMWIAYKLVLPEDSGEDDGKHASQGFWGAMRTIIIADAIMGLDNVLAIGGVAAGAEHGGFVLVVLGLLISIPIVVWGSTLILRLVDRFPAITYLGAAVLAFTAAKMITSEPFFKAYFEGRTLQVMAIQAATVILVLSAGYFTSRKHQRRQDQARLQELKAD